MNNQVHALGFQADGSLLAGGAFTRINGQPASWLVRILPSGVRDGAFMHPMQSTMNFLGVHPDGTIHAGTERFLSRLEPTGQEQGPGLDFGYTILSTALQPDNGVLVAGAFGPTAGQPYSRLVRMLPDGTVDLTFAPQPNGEVIAVAVQPDGRILVGGSFTSIAGQPRERIARLNADGSLDGSFNSGANYPVYTLAVQADGNILVGGAFSLLGGLSVERIGRLAPSGAAEAGFNPRANSGVYSIALQADGKIILCGYFSTIGDQPRMRIARLLPNGTLDSTFDPTAGDPAVFTPDGPERIMALAIQTDGKIVVGGTFTKLGGRVRERLARLMNTEPATSQLNIGGSDVTWLRGGTSPEVVRTTFQVITNGTDWGPPQPGTRIAGGWRASGLVVPLNSSLWVHGLAVGGVHNGSFWPIQLFQGPPVIQRQPANQRINQGASVAFAVHVVGNSSLTYRWRKGDAFLVDNGRIVGAQTAVLSLLNVSMADAGSYSVEVSSSDGNIVSTPALLTVIDPFLLSSPVSLNVYEGQPATFQVSAGGSAPLSYQWRRDGIPLPNATSNSLTFSVTRHYDAGNLDVIVRSPSGSITSLVATLTVRRVVDGFNPNLDSTVHTVALQSDGLILAGGAFTKVGGRPCPPLVRLYPDGARDPEFSASFSSNAIVNAIALQPDGKMLVGMLNASNSALVRIHADGSLDSGFLRAFSGGVDNIAFNARGVYALSLRPNGQVLVAGNFTLVDGQPRRNLARLNADGTLDTTFNPSPDGPVASLLVLPDDRILAGGWFGVVGGLSFQNLVRLSPNGTPDAGFYPNPNFPVYAMGLQNDGRVVLGGAFVKLGNISRIRLARVDSAGALDLSFNGGADAEPQFLQVLVDGNILLAGRFQGVTARPQKWIAHLFPDGTVNTNFNPTMYDLDDPLWPPPSYRHAINCVAVQPDGNILCGGAFRTLGSFPALNLGRALPPPGAPPIETLSVDGSTATWLRSGPLPEFEWTTFETSANGTDWSQPVAGNRVTGGWRATGLGLPAGSRVRARGFLSGGGRNGSTWFQESRTGPPVILRHPITVNAKAGTTASFFTAVAGDAALTYQWLRNGLPITDTLTLSGTHRPTLTFTNLGGPDVGAYSMVAANSHGSVTSNPAMLYVGDPLILTNPVSAQAFEGYPASFNVVIAGTGPFAYQWRKDGTNLAVSNAATLSWARVTITHAGSYDVVVSGLYGSVTSSVVNLKVFTRSLPDSFNPGADGYVGALAELPDGRLLVAGGFTQIAGLRRSFIARLQADGAPDPNFNAGANDAILALAIQPDGRTVLAGQFTAIAGQPRSFLARLKSDGTLDPDFLPQPDWIVTALALQPDGKLVIGGQFSSIGNARRDCLARLHPDGTLDEAFDPRADSYVQTLALQPDGRILVGGHFARMGGQAHRYLARLRPDGNIDAAFAPSFGGVVYALAVQPDGRIVVGGEAWQDAHLTRLNPDGSFDYSFHSGAGGSYGVPDEPVYALALQTDGRILVGGEFKTLGGLPRDGLARLNPNGSLDTGFNPGARGAVYVLTPQADGHILVGGAFTTLGGQTRLRIGRLGNTEPATQSLSQTETQVIWQRGGTSPEVWRTTFEQSTDGSSWTALGAGTPTANGWELGGLQLPAKASVRARGYLQNGSAWFVQAITLLPGPAAPPQILIHPFALLPDGRFQFELTSTPGARLEIQAGPSLDTDNWLPIRVLTNSSGSSWHTDSTSSDPNRFYRVRQLP